VKFKLANFILKQELVKFKVSRLSKNQELAKFNLAFFSKSKVRAVRVALVLIMLKLELE
jgi:hypothetical protein